jgi:type I restriction enzyme, S subunit
MNIDELRTLAGSLDEFVHVPGGIDRLRKTILHMASSGELVSHQVDAVHEERNTVDETTDLSAPFAVPEHWRWTRLGESTRFIDYRGRTPRKTDSGVRLVTAKNVRTGYVRREPEEFIASEDYEGWMTRGFPTNGDVLFTTEAPLANVALFSFDERIALAQRVICISTLGGLLGKFLMFVLMAPEHQRLIRDIATGTTVLGVRASKLKQLPIPVPPLLEQEQIVTQLEDTFALIEKLEATHKDEQAARALMTRIAFRRLVDQQDPLALDHLCELIKTTNDVKVLDNAILSLAVSGQLVPQDGAAELRTIATSDPSHNLFPLPRSWRWVQLADVATYLQRGKSPKYVDSSSVAVLSQKCVRWRKLDWSACRYIDDSSIASYDPQRILQPGDLLINSTGTGTIGRVCLFDPAGHDRVVADGHVTVCRLRDVEPRFVELWFRSDAVQSRIRDWASGSTNQIEWNLSALRSLPIPLPPAPEQIKIIERVDEFAKMIRYLELELSA